MYTDIIYLNRFYNELKQLLRGMKIYDFREVYALQEEYIYTNEDGGYVKHNAIDHFSPYSGYGVKSKFLDWACEMNSLRNCKSFLFIRDDENENKLPENKHYTNSIQ